MSTTLSISLSSLERIKNFESLIADMKGKFALCSGHYVVEAKSVMGILSMDLSKPLLVRVHENGEQAEQIMKMFQEFTLT